MSLAVKYRPQTFEECCGQQSIITILNKQLQTSNLKNSYLFCGPSGCGKTTIARIFANRINNGKGAPIEIDGASNNGVDNVREIIQLAKERSIDSEYKIFIIDECHQLTMAAWSAFLKCIEECPKYTIFMFATTDPQKVPATIVNRCMRFNLTKIKTDDIVKRLIYICEQEGFTNYNESCAYVAKLAQGGMRDAISYLEKASDYSKELKIENVLNALGNFSYEVMFDLTYAITDKHDEDIIKIINYLDMSGNDLKLFISTYLEFILDLTKYSYFKDVNCVKIPATMLAELNYATRFQNAIQLFNKLCDELLELNYNLKNDGNPQVSIMITLLRVSREL